MSVGITARVRRIVLERDQQCCVSCGRWVDVTAGRYSIHHRVPRGLGGSSLPWIGLPANLLVLCGSATDGGCHSWAESNREQAYEWGYLIRRYHGDFQPPEYVKVLTPDGWVSFDNDGGRTPVVMTADESRFAAEWERARLVRMGAAA